MTNMKRWVVEGFLTGPIYIPENNINLPVIQGRVKLTPYAVLEQNLDKRESLKIFLGLEIPANSDHVCIAWQEMEAFVRALGIGKNVPITVNAFRMTDKTEEFPDGINFLKSRNFPICESSWEPVNHNMDIKNRVRIQGDIYGIKAIDNLDPVIEGLHKAVLVNDEYISGLIKDYMMGLEVEHRHPSLAMLYYFKVLECIGKKEYNDSAPTMATKTLTALIRDMGGKLTNKENQKAKSIIRWRNTKSEAHFMIEGKPHMEELKICKKMAHFYISRAINFQEPYPKG